MFSLFYNFPWICVQFHSDLYPQMLKMSFVHEKFDF